MSLQRIVLPAALVAVTAFASAFSVSAVEHKRVEEGKWMELGSRQVDFKSDHDTIEVGKSEGRFTALRIDVAEGDLVMEKMKITFGDGSTYEPKTKVEFKPGQTSQTIDLPNKSHVIKKVDFTYHSKGKHEKAMVMLFGKEA